MKKERYERIELEIFEFQTEDVIVTSGGFPKEGDNELPIRGDR
ncbi:hypothetical protein [uncultured Ruminococcus sp.]|nr:hypothetical protein [uncultured Ruminococcus sp.]